MATKDDAAKMQMHQLVSSWFKSEYSHKDEHNGPGDLFSTDTVHLVTGTLFLNTSSSEYFQCFKAVFVLINPGQICTTTLPL